MFAVLAIRELFLTVNFCRFTVYTFHTKVILIYEIRCVSACSQHVPCLKYDWCIQNVTGILYKHGKLE